MRPWVKTVYIVAVVAIVCLWARQTFAGGQVIRFSFHDTKLLRREHRLGATAFISGLPNSDTPLPLVVFLHGLNPSGILYRWFGAASDVNLTDVASRLISGKQTAPFVLAGLSQTRQAAHSGQLWPDFDLNEFVGAVEREINNKVVIDRTRVVLMAHSAAGCNVRGGALGAVVRETSLAPRDLVLIDTCMNSSAARNLQRAAPRTRLWLRWQGMSWKRDVGTFQRDLELGLSRRGHAPASMAEMHPVGRNPHDAVVIEAFWGLLPALLPAQSARACPMTADGAS